MKYNVKYMLPNGKFCLDCCIFGKDIEDVTRKAESRFERLITKESTSKYTSSEYVKHISRAKLLIVKY